MKIVKLGQVLGLVAKSSTLLVLVLLSFQAIECKSDKNSQKNPRTRVAPVRNKPAAVVEVAENNEGYSKTIEEKPLKKSDHVQSSVSVKSTELEDGSVVEVKTTIKPMPQEGKVVTTTETWTMYDYAKAAAIGAAALGAVGLGIAYRDQIADQFNNGYNAASSWWNGSPKVETFNEVETPNIEDILKKDSKDWTPEDQAALGKAIQEHKEYQALDLFKQKIEKMTPEEKQALAKKYAKSIDGGAIAGGVAGAIAGGATGAVIGAGSGAAIGTGMGAVRGVQTFRAGGSPKAVVGKVAMNALQGTAIGAGMFAAEGATFGAGLGVGIGATAASSAVLGSDLVNTMEVPADYKATPIAINRVDETSLNIPAVQEELPAGA